MTLTNIHAYTDSCQHQPVPSTSTQSTRVKRALEEDDQMPATSVTSMSEGGAAMEMSEGSEAEKRMRTETGGSHSNPQERQGGVDLNFPLSGEKGPACLVKVHINAGFFFFFFFFFFWVFVFLFCFVFWGDWRAPLIWQKFPPPPFWPLSSFIGPELALSQPRFIPANLKKKPQFYTNFDHIYAATKIQDSPYFKY